MTTMDYKTAACYLGVSPGTLANWVWKKKISYIKVGKLTRFLKEDLDTWLTARRVPEGGRP